MEGQLYFWSREAKGSSAEVDYLLTVDQNIIPIEVKSGSSGRLKSMRIFMEEKKASLGVHLSINPLEEKGTIILIPLYMVAEIPRFVRESIDRNGDI